MCTIIVLRRPGHDWPVLIAANRDELRNRPWKAPGRHWPDRPEVLAGLDLLAGGSWLGLNDHGVVAAALNREGTLGPAAGKRSRGELVLDALDHGDAADAAHALGALDPAAYRPFNLVVADNRDAFLLSHRDPVGGAPIAVERLPEGLSMITSLDLDDPRAPRIRFHRPKFLTAPVPDPSGGDWSAWEALLASRDGEPESGARGALFIDPVPAGDPGAFGTVASSLIALPAVNRPDLAPIWRFADGPPEHWRWEIVPFQGQPATKP
jgi:hypothetical protein